MSERLRWACLLAVGLSLLACDGAARFRVTFTWEDPPPPDLSQLYAVLRVEARGETTAVLAQSAPEPFGEGVNTDLEFALGRDRVLVIELRDGPDPQALVRYYGLSEPFDARAGEVVEVVVALKLRAPPGEGISMEIVGQRDGYIATADVELHLRGDGAERVQLSDISDFAGGRVQTLDLDALPPGPSELGPEVRVAPWTLDQFATCPDEGQCVRRVHARFIDAQGYTSRTLSSGDIVIDREAPSLLPDSVDVLLLPRDTNLRRDLDAVGPLTDARISFSSSEVLAMTPTVSLDGTDLRLRRVGGNFASFTYELDGARAVLEGARTLSVSMIDRAGNAATETLGATVRVDSTAPRPLSANPGAVVLERAPFGAVRTNGEPAVSVVAAPGAAEPGAEVVFYSDSDVASASLLGRVDVDAQGAFSGSLFDPGDRARVFAVVIDDAGNPSDDDRTRAGLQAAQILDSRWTASLSAPEGLQNPHRVTGHVSVARNLPVGGFEISSPQRLSRNPDTPTSPYVLETNRLWQVLRRADIGPPSFGADAVAYDVGRDRAVVFVGTWSEAQTFELDGDRWLDRTVVGAVAPPPRRDSAMAYDAARGRVVLFGGIGSGALLLNDLWEWDGDQWRELTPQGPLPPPRSGHVMVFDESRGRIVIFGGGRIDEVDPQFLADTWEWDGERWYERPGSGASVPRGRIFGAATYDGRDDSVLMFGGCARIGSGRACVEGLDDTWRYTGTRWAQVSTSTSPPMDGRPSMAFDPTSGDTLVFVGAGVDGDYGRPQKLWRFDGGDWSRDPDLPFVGRTAPKTITRTLHGDVIVSGGCAQRFLSYHCQGPLSAEEETWRLTQGSWQRVRTSTAWPDEPRRVALAPGEGRALVLTTEDDEHGVYAWDGSSWSDADVFAGPRPGSRFSMTWAHDPIGGGMLLSGGSSHRDIWRFANDRWSVVTASAAVLPPARYPSGASTPDGIILPVGRESDTRGVWRWDGTAWSVIEPAAGREGPIRDTGNASVYDPRAAELLMFGGSWRDLPAGIRWVNELWAWDGLGWTRRMPPGPRPPARRAYAFSYDARAARTILFGGVGPFNPLSDTWAWDGASWSELLDSRVSRPSEIYQISFYDEVREAVTLVGSSELWSLPPPPEDQRPGVLFAAHWGSADLPDDGIAAIDVSVVAGGRGADLGGAALDGAQVLVWDAWRTEWVPLASNDASVVQPAAIDASASLGRRAISGHEGRIYVMVRPRGATGPDEAEAQIAVSFIELTVQHRDL